MLHGESNKISAKCPVCGALGNKVVNTRFLYCCTYCTTEGLFFDDKGQKYYYSFDGKLLPMGVAEPSKENLTGFSLTGLINVFGVDRIKGKELLVKNDLYKSSEKNPFIETSAGKTITA